MGTIKRAKLTRSDLSLFDGENTTYSRTDATGGTVSGLRLGDQVDLVSVFGSGTNYTVATINAATSRLGSRNRTLLFSVGTWTIDSSVTIPSNFASYIPAGCVFSISSGVTLTFSGPVHVEYAGTDGTGWYTGDGSVSCSVGASGFPGW